MQEAGCRVLSRTGTFWRNPATSADGDVQMGDRVAMVYDRNGVAKVVRDTGYRQD